MKLRASPSLPAIVALGVAACTVPGVGSLTYDQPPETATAGTTGASDGAPATTGEPAPTTGTTGEAPGTSTTSSGPTSEPGSTTADDPFAPPAIVKGKLDVDVLVKNEPLVVTIETANAEGVRMRVDGGPEIELVLDTEEESNLFTGQIVIYTALENDDPHFATFVAWRGALESETYKLPFTVALPPAGSELFWEGDSTIGKGTVVALAVTPKLELIELGTYYPQGQARCYLRRRDLGGAWGPDDLFEVKPGLPCSAIDLVADDDGALHVLVDKLEGGELRWWLGKYDDVADTPTQIGTGVVGDVARALTLDRDDNRVAVCGNRPDGDLVRAAVWLFTPGEPGKNLSYDYVPENEFPDPIGFGETPNDCAFLAHHLLVTGEVKGQHDQDSVTRSRHFLLDVDADGENPEWRIAPQDSGSQSGGRVLTLDPGGRAISAGYACGDQCEHLAELRMFTASSDQVWQRSLDPLLADPRALAWHPAGYVVFVAARDGQQGSTSFFAEAWFPLQAAPVWSYAHQDALAIHTPTSLAIGPYGQIYAGGTTAGGYPAVAVIAP
ncbi:hypothetical protein OV203_36605 [Nannocystis sp. ILAH1]|uniref:hypothetical protein n=1 Tax=Nannocystis sp. ILAH1 TaxID=2996789 RepID=UPI00226E5014|nr:hypothetical protein [Nannocystis sp. ILAH1]MCY0992719.1 hypothetical protein [Nannocystis sp. ILAH1]